MNKKIIQVIVCLWLSSAACWAKDAPDLVIESIRFAGHSQMANHDMLARTLTLIALNPDPGIIEIKNNSNNITAKNIVSTIPSGWDVTTDVSDCIEVVPGATCKLKFFSGTQEHPNAQTIFISGENTTTVTAMLKVKPG